MGLQPPLLQVTDLWVEAETPAGAIPLVRGVSFAVSAGTITGIVGESGSGKSLSALSLMRLNPSPTRIVRGDIMIDGLSVQSLSEREMEQVRGAKIAMVYQDPMWSLNPVRTIGWQVAQALRVHDRSVTRHQARERAAELLDAVGIDNPRRRIAEYPHHLSGGMRQRVVIAMAIAPGPRVLVADEATTALDGTTQIRIMDLLQSLVAERNMAAIVITHDIALASRVCETLHVMYAGRIVESGRTSDVLQAPYHPYAGALLESICSLETDRDRPIAAIRGQPPSPGSLPKGCAFAPRCRFALDVCNSQPPPNIVVSDRTVECVLAEDGVVPIWDRSSSRIAKG